MVQCIHMNTTYSLPDEKKLAAIRKRHGLLLMLLHGSQLGMMTHERSDVDVAVLRDPRKPPFRYLFLYDDLIEAFGSDRVDLADLTHADPLLLYAVTKNCRLLSGDPAHIASLQKKAFHRYSDYLPYLTAEKQFIRGRIGSYVTP